MEFISTAKGGLNLVKKKKIISSTTRTKHLQTVVLTGSVTKDTVELDVKEKVILDLEQDLVHEFGEHIHAPDPETGGAWCSGYVLGLSSIQVLMII